jgi:hypothetical protein
VTDVQQVEAAIRERDGLSRRPIGGDERDEPLPADGVLSQGR